MPGYPGHRHRPPSVGLVTGSCDRTANGIGDGLEEVGSQEVTRSTVEPDRLAIVHVQADVGTESHDVKLHDLTARRETGT